MRKKQKELVNGLGMNAPQNRLIIRRLTRILTVSEKFEEYAKQVEQRFRDAGLRVSCDLRSEKIGAKIREGRLDLVPYLAVVGAKESENGTVALRSRKEGELGEVPVGAVVEKLSGEVTERQL